MIVLASREKILEFLEEEVKCWESVGGGPNLNAFIFDPTTTDPQILHEAGYYTNREAWLSGVQIKRLKAFIQEIQDLPQYMGG